MLKQIKIKKITDSFDGGYHVTVLTEDSVHGFHHSLVAISSKEKNTNSLGAKPKVAVEAMIKIKAKKLHADWVASRVKELAQNIDRMSIVSNSDLGA